MYPSTSDHRGHPVILKTMNIFVAFIGISPLGRFSQIAIGLGSIICLVWVAVVLWARFYH
jgi:hypothetical protein